ncbi:transforming growth factor-beta receptor type 3-like protein isoform X2 [Xenopus laevis]|uniref:Transforming growth factor-beta receptor type 3-like protein isoform X2 n=1 Tax=Xenopus laevis TaxID=8355 RepID=A0A8J1MMW5_XENLA|nr:transforming growth factor-beta receptor type 3-like protein isoform X2 [Xenopus laevis]
MHFWKDQLESNTSLLGQDNPVSHRPSQCAWPEMYLLFYMCAGLAAAPPPWVNIEVPQALQLSETPHLAKSSVMCHHDKMAAIPQGDDSPCKSRLGLEHSLRASVAKMQVRGPAVHCERGGVCSVTMGSRVQVEVSLASAPPYLGLFLSLCALSPSSDPFNHSQQPLLANGCPLKPDVSLFLTPPTPCYTPAKNFSFRLGPFYNHSIQFLHCHVAFCVQDPSLCRDGGTNIPKCPIPDGTCSSISPPLLKTMAHYVRTVTQPLIVTIPVASNSLLQPRAGHKTAPLPTHAEPGVQGVSIAAAVGVTLCSFVIGVMLTAGLWLIHSKTAPASPVKCGATQELQASCI